MRAEPRWSREHCRTDPAVGVDVESLNIMTKLLSRLQSPELHVGAARPVRVTLGVTDVGEAGHHADALRHQPEREILGQDELAPDGQEEQPGEDPRVPEGLGCRPELGEVEGAHHVSQEVAETDQQSLQPEGYRGGGQTCLVLGRDELSVLGQAELGAYEVSSDEERMRQHLEYVGRRGQSCLQLVLAQTLGVFLESLPVIEVPAEANQPETEDTLRHGPANVVLLPGLVPVPGQQVGHVHQEADGDPGHGAAQAEEGEVGEEYRVERVSDALAYHPVRQQEAGEEEVEMLSVLVSPGNTVVLHLDVEESSEDLLRQQSSAIKNQFGHP